MSWTHATEHDDSEHDDSEPDLICGTPAIWSWANWGEGIGVLWAPTSYLHVLDYCSTFAAQDPKDLLCRDQRPMHWKEMAPRTLTHINFPHTTSLDCKVDSNSQLSYYVLLFWLPPWATEHIWQLSFDWWRSFETKTNSMKQRYSVRMPGPKKFIMLSGKPSYLGQAWLGFPRIKLLAVHGRRARRQMHDFVRIGRNCTKRCNATWRVFEKPPAILLGGSHLVSHQDHLFQKA